MQPRKLMSFGARFGELVRHKRGVEGLSQEQLAQLAFGDYGGKSRISMIENGRVAVPQQRTVDALAIALNIQREEIEACRLSPSGEDIEKNHFSRLGRLQSSEVSANLADALISLGMAKQDLSLIEQALDIYRAALKLTSQTEAPNEWAHLQNRIGLALQATATHTGDSRYLVEAIEAFKSALKAIDHR